MEMRGQQDANVSAHPLRLNHAGETSPESERHTDTLLYIHTNTQRTAMSSHISFMSNEFRQFGATGKTQVKI